MSLVHIIYLLGFAKLHTLRNLDNPVNVLLLYMHRQPKPTHLLLVLIYPKYQRFANVKSYFE